MLDTLGIAPTTEALHDGNVLVFYTDGATGVPRHSLDQRQWTDLVATACRPAGTAEAIADNIRDSLEEVVPFAQRNDDVALLVLKVMGDPI